MTIVKDVIRKYVLIVAVALLLLMAMMLRFSDLYFSSSSYHKITKAEAKVKDSAKQDVAEAEKEKPNEGLFVGCNGFF